MEHSPSRDVGKVPATAMPIDVNDRRMIHSPTHPDATLLEQPSTATLPEKPSTATLPLQPLVTIRQRASATETPAQRERRQKNNLAAKRSRDQRRIREDKLAQQTQGLKYIEEESTALLKRLRTLLAEY